ncbi:MAG TPA: DUF4097 family beta strand repeat-containing protein [Terriglobales bacterium]|nr:DUF4097 family beta strand repeat-containing protein [Terriglobales bacterium]
MKNQRWRGIAILAVMLAFATAAFAAEEGTFDRALKVTGPVEMEVATGSGQIMVHSGAAGAVTIKGTVRVSDSWMGTSDAKAKLQRILGNPPVEQSGNVIKIGRVDDPELRRNVSISYEIVTPAETRLVAKTGSGDQTVAGLRGPVEIATGSGRLRANDIGSEVRASSGSGDIGLENINGAVRASTGSGRVSALRVAGSFDASSGSGEIESEQTAGGNARVSTGSGSIRLRGVKGALTVSTGSGDIQAQGEPTSEWKVDTGSGSVELHVPQQAAFDVYARSSSGRITVDHPMTVRGTINRHEVRGSVRGGGALLNVHTASGNIEVR